jgi:hypothetical protein
VVVVTLGLGLSDIVHLVDTTALGAALDRAVLGDGEPDDDVAVDGVTGAAKVALLAEGGDDDGILHGSYIHPSASDRITGATRQSSHTLAASVQRPHVENINTLHLSEDLETLQSSRLLEVGRNGSGSGAGSEQVFLAADLYSPKSSISSPLPVRRVGLVGW